MRIRNVKTSRIAIMLAVLALLPGGCTGGTTAPTGPVTVCELAYYTGAFADYGPWLTNDVRFAVEEVVNTDPPLGREWKLVSIDIGDDREDEAAKECLEKKNAEILVSIAHQYKNYRDWMIDYWQENDSPLGPSVHGGAIPVNLGGKAAEPIFRGQGTDQALGVYGALYAQQEGLNKVVIFATQVEGFQLAADSAEAAAAILGLEVLDRIDVKAGETSYRAEAQKIADLKPDAVIVQAGSVESAALIKGAQEAGLVTAWVGETGWSEVDFYDTLGSDPIEKQKSIGYPSFAADKSGKAWEFFEPLWNGQTGCTEGVKECPPYKADNQYAFSTYDLMVQTALAVEAAGSYKASDWSKAMFEVGDGGEKCYTYADCLKLIRGGKDVDYDGVTGPGLYTDGGVNSVTPAYMPYKPDGTTGDPVLLDAEKGFELLDQVKVEAECTPENPPNKCKFPG